MENNENEQGVQQEKKPEEKQTSHPDWREAIFQRLRDMGIEVIDATKEWEGTTTIIIPFRKPSQEIEENEQKNKQEERKS